MKAQPPIRVLVVDDSVVVRKVLTEALSADSGLEVVGTAPDGRVALAKIAQCRPDVITLDVEMPVMDGLEALKEIRKSSPRLPVVMFSMLTEAGAAATLDALALGASDYVTKPSGVRGPAAAVERIRGELIPKIRALAAPNAMAATAKPVRQPSVSAGSLSRTRPIEIVAIGTSTGGPNALNDLLPAIPKDFPVPIVTVQHMPPIFTRLLAERLDGRAQISIEEGRDGEELLPGSAWIAPGNFHMMVKRAASRVRIELDQGPPEHSCRPSVDVLFRSVAAAYGPSVLAVVMTGMGADGVLGAGQVRKAGGEVLVQDEASSVVWGMAGLTYSAGHASGIYPLDRLAPEIVRRVMESRKLRESAESKACPALEPSA